MQQRRREFPGGKLGSPAQGVSPPVLHQGSMVPRLSSALIETRTSEVRRRGCCPALQRGRRSIQPWLSIGRCGWIVVLRLSADAEVCQCRVCPATPLDGDRVRCRRCLLYLCDGRPPMGRLVVSHPCESVVEASVNVVRSSSYATGSDRADVVGFSSSATGDMW